LTLLAIMTAPGTATAKLLPKVYGWGNNPNGDLGNGTTSPSEVPVAASVLGEATEVAGGSYFSVALLPGGTVDTWGSNVYDELGDGVEFAEETEALVPQPVPGLSGVKAIAAGSSFVIALLSNGSVVAWGNGGSGELGDGLEVDEDEPVSVSGLTGVKAIAAGGASALALLSNGTVMSWGYNSHGQLGDGSTTSSLVPVPVSGLSKVKAIAEGAFFGLAVGKGGDVKAWGAGSVGELGDGSESDSDVPVSVAGLSGVKSLAAGGYHALALLSAGTVKSWGANTQGELGDGSFTEDSLLPVSVSGLAGVKAIAAGSAHSLALLKSKTVVSWGENEYGELGDGTLEKSDVPVAVSSLTGVKTIGSGTTSTFSLAST